jgi:hypothetical protein
MTSGDLLFAAFVSYRTEISKGGMQPFSLVKGFNVCKNGEPDLRMGHVTVAIYPFGFEQANDGLYVLAIHQAQQTLEQA